MSCTNTKNKPHEKTYDVNVIVELLIHETSQGRKYAPEIGNLCIGFTSLNSEALFGEIEDMRGYWPYLFPKALSTEKILQIVEKKYPAYEEVMVLKEVE